MVAPAFAPALTRLARIIHEAFYRGRRSSASSAELSKQAAFTRICSTLGALATNVHD